MKFPEYMQKGSSGPCVTVLQVFLVGAGFYADGSSSNIVFDKEFGEVTAKVLARWQRVMLIKDDGQCGPETRYHMLMSGFNFEAACRAIGGEVSFFVQPDGSKVDWLSSSCSGPS